MENHGMSPDFETNGIYLFPDYKFYSSGVIIEWNIRTIAQGEIHDDVIKAKHFPRNWPFVREIHRSPVNFPHKGQWRGALMFSLIYAWINDWVNNREAGDLRHQHDHYDVIVMNLAFLAAIWQLFFGNHNQSWSHLPACARNRTVPKRRF